jgi:hypothetical protein
MKSVLLQNFSRPPRPDRSFAKLVAAQAVSTHNPGNEGNGDVTPTIPDPPPPV